MRLAECTDMHKPLILDILNDAIVNTTALYEYRPRTLQLMDAWFEAKRQGDYPVIGAFDEEGDLLGFGTYGPFRNYPGFKYTVEHSVYVKGSARGKGVGTFLLEGVISKAVVQDYHVLVGAIDADNTASIRLHEKAGFSLSGKISQAGFKFGRWLDLAFYQMILRTPSSPTDG